MVVEFNGVPVTDATDLTAQVRAQAGGSDDIAHVRARRRREDHRCDARDARRVVLRLQAGRHPAIGSRGGVLLFRRGQRGEAGPTSAVCGRTPRDAPHPSPQGRGMGLRLCGGHRRRGARAVAGRPRRRSAGGLAGRRPRSRLGMPRPSASRPFPSTRSAGSGTRPERAVVVVTHGFGDVNRYAVTGAFVVQLWHGIPLKRIGLDSAETLRPPAALGRGILSRHRESGARHRVLSCSASDPCASGSFACGAGPSRIRVRAARSVRSGDGRAPRRRPVSGNGRRPPGTGPRADRCGHRAARSGVAAGALRADVARWRARSSDPLRR